MASDQKVNGGTDPGTTPARKRRRARKVTIRYADEATKAACQALAAQPKAPLPEGTKAKVVASEFGRSRRVELVPPKPKVEEPKVEEGLDTLGAYVVARLREAGETMALMPGIGGGYAEREFPLPDPEAITRMDEVMQEWFGWCRTMDERRIVGWFVAGLSWRAASRKDPHGRSHEGLRKAFGKIVAHLTQQLVAQGKTPPKWLLTELTKKG